MGDQRRRGDALEQAILAAAWDELARVGYAGVTMAGIAARAGTSKPVLYRRWPDKHALLAAVLEQRLPDLAADSADTADTKTLRGDVVAVLRALALRWDSSPNDLADPMIRGRARRHARTRAHRHMQTVLHRAHDRGELDATHVPQRLTQLPVDLLCMELLTREHDPHPTAGPDGSDAAIGEIIDVLFLPLLGTAGLRGSPQPKPQLARGPAGQRVRRGSR